MENKKYQINGSTESEEIVAKSDVCLVYEDDNKLYNIFKLSLINQQVKCTGDMKTSSSSFELMFDGYIGIRCEDGNQSYSLLSKNILKTKTVPFAKKEIALTLDQKQYYPIYIICHRCEIKLSDMEKLFPQLIYHLFD